MAEPTPTTPLSPRTSDVSEYLRDNDFMESSIALTRPRSSASEASIWSHGRKTRRHSKLRHALGIGLLLATVFLWTASNFMSSSIFADSSYSKPYFVTYVNTSFFIIPLIPMFLHHLWADRANPTHRQPILTQWRDFIQRRAGKWSLLRDHESRSSSFSSKSHADSHNAATELLLSSSTHDNPKHDDSDSNANAGLTLRATARLSLEFCILWFLANYFAAACLEYTTVASSTILASTSSIWTLLCGAALRVERFTLRKCLGVGASLAGVALISTIDVSGETDENRGSFPHKSPRELALGDVMAFVSAVLYGFYAVLMKKRIRDESRVNMPLFFGCVGLFNIILLWPGLIILHMTGVETFQLPPSRTIFTIVMANSASSLVSDFCWAYAVCLTSPLIVTVGLSLTIPLSLIGQIVLDGQYASVWYWVGAVVVVLSFVFVNKEDLNDDDEDEGLQGGDVIDGTRAGFQSVATADCDHDGDGDGDDDSGDEESRRSSSIRGERQMERAWRSVHGIVDD